MSTNLGGKVAIVTGAASGIGRAVAESYAQAGARVVVSDVDEMGGRETVEIIKSTGAEAIFVRADVSRPDDNETLVAETLKQFGRLDIACNNAGIGGRQGDIAETPPEEWNRVIGINLSGIFYGMHFEIPAMLKTGGGAIVNVGSILSRVGFRGHSPYVAAKHGMIGLAQNAALEYGSRNIRVNTVGPAFIKTPMLDNLPEGALEFLATQHPIGRLGEPHEVAELVLWLSSESASFVTGSYYAVDGGYLSR